MPSSITEWGQKLIFKISPYVPVFVREGFFIQMMATVTTYDYGDTIVPSLSAMDAYQRWTQVLKGRKTRFEQGEAVVYIGERPDFRGRVGVVVGCKANRRETVYVQWKGGSKPMLVYRCNVKLLAREQMARVMASS